MSVRIRYSLVCDDCRFETYQVDGEKFSLEGFRAMQLAHGWKLAEEGADGKAVDYCPECVKRRAFVETVDD